MSEAPDAAIAPESDAVLAPHATLELSGVPPVPCALAKGIARYTASSPVDVVAWHPARRELLGATRTGETVQLHRLGEPEARLEPLTDFADPVRDAVFEPVRGDTLVYARDAGGDEASQLYRLDLASGRSTRLTDPSWKHGEASWNRRGDRIAFVSMPLDRIAGRSDRVESTLSIVDPAEPASVRRVATLAGGGWESLRWSRDGLTIYAIRSRSVGDGAIWAIDVADGTSTRLLPNAGRAGTVSFTGLEVSRDGRRLVFTSDESGEFRRLTTMDLASGACRPLTADLGWDVVAFALSGGDACPEEPGELVAAIVDVDGRHALAVFAVDDGREISLPALPDAARNGSVSHLAFSRAGGGGELAFTVASARSPGDAWSLDVRGGGPATRWARAPGGGVDASSFRDAEIVRWPSFDGRTISGLVHRPPARFAGPRPVLVHIHGGPESQATVGFLGANARFVEELGIACLQPNVRGSTGYGKTFVTLDDRERREDAVRDIGALLDWIATQPDLDASRVLVAGRSYGGYMSLAVATHYAERIVASIAIVGISHFTSFLERTESYRRDLRRDEYGDERDPAMRAFFERISPLANAHRIAKPLLVVAGRNDPRVPYEESERIVASVRAAGVPVWQIVAGDEGHVFQKKANIDFVACAQALFVELWLLGAAAERREAPIA